MSENAMIVIGMSAGGLSPLLTIVRSLPPDLATPVCVVQHMPAEGPTLLPEILSTAGGRRARLPADRAPIEPGWIYVSQPDHHLIIEQGHLHVVRGPKENGFRPAVDVLFRTAARVYGPRAIGVVLSGLLDDGTAGLLAIKRHGGRAIVQDPADAEYSSMPETAIRYIDVNAILPAAAIADCLMTMLGDPGNLGNKRLDQAITVTTMQDNTDLEAGISRMDRAALQKADELGTPVPFSCPDCGGVLAEYYDGPLLRFRCQTGHAFSRESVFAFHSDMIDRSLWATFNALNERVNLARRLVKDAQTFNDTLSERRFSRLIEQAEHQKEMLRRLMLIEQTDLADAESA